MTLTVVFTHQNLVLDVEVTHVVIEVDVLGNDERRNGLALNTCGE